MKSSKSLNDWLKEIWSAFWWQYLIYSNTVQFIFYINFYKSQYMLSYNHLFIFYCVRISSWVFSFKIFLVKFFSLFFFWLEAGRFPLSLTLTLSFLKDFFTSSSFSCSSSFFCAIQQYKNYLIIWYFHHKKKVYAIKTIQWNLILLEMFWSINL